MSPKFNYLKTRSSYQTPRSPAEFFVPKSTRTQARKQPILTPEIQKILSSISVVTNDLSFTIDVSNEALANLSQKQPSLSTLELINKLQDPQTIPIPSDSSLALEFQKHLGSILKIHMHDNRELQSQTTNGYITFFKHYITHLLIPQQISTHVLMHPENYLNNGSKPR